MVNEKGNIIMIDGGEYIHCPICGELVETYDICDRCHWQNTGSANIDGGPHKITLAEAKELFTKDQLIKGSIYQ